MGVASRLFGRLESAPQSGVDADRLEVVRRHDLARHALGPVAGGERRAGDLVADD
jgi:hypothetical protein